MNIEELKVLINNIIENEYKHVQDYNVIEAMENDKEWNETNENMSKVFSEIYKDIPKELKSKIDELDALIGLEESYLERYYFKKGVEAALTGLSFLSDIKNIECIL